jgi:hypothetical protein
MGNWCILLHPFVYPLFEFPSLLISRFFRLICSYPMWSNENTASFPPSSLVPCLYCIPTPATPSALPIALIPSSPIISNPVPSHRVLFHCILSRPSLSRPFKIPLLSVGPSTMLPRTLLVLFVSVGYFPVRHVSPPPHMTYLRKLSPMFFSPRMIHPWKRGDVWNTLSLIYINHSFHPQMKRMCFKLLLPDFFLTVTSEVHMYMYYGEPKICHI